MPAKINRYSSIPKLPSVRVYCQEEVQEDSTKTLLEHGLEVALY